MGCCQGPATCTASALPVRSPPGLAHHAVVPVALIPYLEQSPSLSSYLFPAAHRGLGQTLEPVPLGFRCGSSEGGEDPVDRCGFELVHLPPP